MKTKGKNAKAMEKAQLDGSQKRIVWPKTMNRKGRHQWTEVG